MANELVLYKQALDVRAKQIAQVLPTGQGLDAARVCRLAMTAVERSPKLRDCSPESFAMAVLTCAEMGLEPAFGQADIVPFGKVAKVIIGYQGMIETSFRSGMLRSIWAGVVRDGDLIEVDYGTAHRIRHVPIPNNQGKIIGGYACAELLTGGMQWTYLDRGALDQRREASKGSKDSDWWGYQWPDEWVKKTCMRALWKILPKSATMRLALLQSGREDTDEPQRPETIDVPVVSVSQPWDRPAIAEAAPVDASATDGGADVP